MQLSNGDKNAIIFYSAVAIGIALIMTLSGCGKKAPGAPVILGSSVTGTVYEIPVEQVKDKEIMPAPGKNIDDVVAVVVVPPSDKPTTVQVYRQPKTITRKAKEIITGDKGNPDYTLTSDNPGTKAQTGRDFGLWPYLAGAFTLIAGLIAARQWLKRFSWVTRTLSVVRRIIGI